MFISAGIDSLPLIALALFALLLIGMAGITQTVLRGGHASSADRARFLVITMWGFNVALGAYLPIWLYRWIEDPSLVFTIATGAFLVVMLLAIRWRNAHPHITTALNRVFRETQFPNVLTVVLLVSSLILALLNIVSWPFAANQSFYELILMCNLVPALLHFVNLVVFRLEDNPILESPINAGWEGVIYSVPDEEGKVLKLFNYANKRVAEQEVLMTKAAADAGLPCPAVYNDVIEMNGRFGFYMEKIDGLAFVNQGVYSGSKKGLQLSEEFGQFHAKLHEIEGVRMPLNYKDVARTSIKNAARISTADKERILGLLEGLPDGDRVYHGDFHPGNVMRRNDNGELVIIDWVRAMTGHPLADVARVSMILSTAWLEMLPVYRWIVKRAVRKFSERYEEAYFEASPFAPHEIKPWRAIATAMRMGEEPIQASHSKFLATKLKRQLREI